MAHNISGIITSFKYVGNLPNIVLVDHYHLITFKSDDETSPSDQTISPYEDLTSEIRATLKELSLAGRCAYIETAYFGGIGVQISETWENGEIIDGPLISYDGVENKMEYEGVTIADYPINQALKNLGVSRQGEKDEFDTVGLGRFRSNRKIIDEYHRTK